MTKYYSTTLEDSEDGSGDAILTFPPDFLIENDWKEDDVISIKRVNDTLVLINTTKDTRDRFNEKV